MKWKLLQVLLIHLFPQEQEKDDIKQQSPQFTYNERLWTSGLANRWSTENFCITDFNFKMPTTQQSSNSPGQMGTYAVTLGSKLSSMSVSVTADLR